MLNRLIGYCGYEPHMLHRLDMNTSGVLVAAKDKATAQSGHRQFECKQVSAAPAGAAAAPSICSMACMSGLQLLPCMRGGGGTRARAFIRLLPGRLLQQ